MSESSDNEMIVNLNTTISEYKINDLSKDENSDKLIFNPFNSLNIEIDELSIKSILSKYGVNKNNIFNINLYKRAFVHRSYTKRPEYENIQSNITIVEQPNDCLALKTKSNERLEFLGDGVRMAKYYLYKRFPKPMKVL